MAATTRIVCPAAAKPGEVIEIKTLIQHQMETGHRRDDVGRPVARDIIKDLAVTYNGTEIFRTEMFPGVSANPYVLFTTTATESGELVFTWTDDAGQKTVERRRLVVG